MEDVTAMHWRCYECNMTFSNPSLLQKHRARFCIGGIGDPDQLTLRRGFRSDVPPGGPDIPDDPDPARYNPKADPKVQQLAENHGRQMEHLQNRNRDLERQRDEIRRRLEGLGRRPTKDDDSMNALLQELKDQEARNQKMLEELRRIMSQQHFIPPPPAEGKKHQFVYPIYYGNSLVAEIIAVRQAYLQNGGNDPDILQQLAQMQAEAQAIDDSLRNRPVVTKIKDKSGHNQSLLTLELENERLQRQLLLLQEQNVQARHRRKDDREGRARVVSNHPHPLTSGQISTQMAPLDFHSNLLGGRRKAKTTDRNFMREEWVTRVDPFKEKIDSDVQNKFGYDYGANRFVLAQPEIPQPVVHPRSDIGIETLVPGLENDVVPPRPMEEKETETKLRPLIYNNKETPYYRNHLTSRRLNQAEKDLRENYSRMSQPNVRGEDIEDFIKFQQRREEEAANNPDVRLNLANLDADASETKNAVPPTTFEDEFFVNTARTEIADEGYNTFRSRPPPQARPKLLIDREAPKKK